MKVWSGTHLAKLLNRADYAASRVYTTSRRIQVSNGESITLEQVANVLHAARELQRASETLYDYMKEGKQ